MEVKNIVEDIKNIRLFIASPCDVQEEREIVREIVDDLNKIDFYKNRMSIEVIGWESDTVSSITGESGQNIVNAQIGDNYDIFLGIMGKRFGTPTDKAGSGTEEEFNNAFDKYRTEGTPHIGFFFSEKPTSIDTEDEANQLLQVIKFKNKLKKIGLITPYEDIFDFEKRVRHFLKYQCDELKTTFLNNEEIEELTPKMNVDDSFKKLLIHFSKQIKSNKVTIGNNFIRLIPDEVSKGGKIVVQNLRKRCFLTYLVGARNFWSSTSGKDYYNLIREKAKQGKDVRRVFILSKEEILNDDDFRGYIQEDVNAGIDVRIILSRHIEDPDDIRDFGLWDCDRKGNEGVICNVFIYPLTNEVKGCEFSTSQNKIINGWKRAKNLWNNPNAKDGKNILDRFRSDENKKIIPKMELYNYAPQMEKLADNYCNGSYLGPRCKWYHKSWQYLRMLDMVSAPDWHNEFFLKNLGDILFNKVDAKILICGLADYSMFTYIYESCKNGARPKTEIDLLDLCQTPLEICNLYRIKKNISVSVNNLQMDALKLKLKGSIYDLVVSDAFVSRFKPKDQITLIKNWKRILKNDGFVVTTIRTKIKQPKLHQKSEEQIQSFVDRAVNEAKKWNSSRFCEEIDIELIKKFAGNYATHITSYPISNEKTVRKLFVDAGFNNIKITLNEVKGECYPTTYAEVVAKIN